jgi:hypothetical protein
VRHPEDLDRNKQPAGRRLGRERSPVDATNATLNCLKLPKPASMAISVTGLADSLSRRFAHCTRVAPKCRANKRAKCRDPSRRSVAVGLYIASTAVLHRPSLPGREGQRERRCAGGRGQVSGKRSCPCVRVASRHIDDGRRQGSVAPEIRVSPSRGERSNRQDALFVVGFSLSNVSPKRRRRGHPPHDLSRTSVSV